MERGVFTRPEMKSRLAKFIRVRLLTNEKNDARWGRLLEERFRTTGIPLYVVLSKDDEVLGTMVFEGGITLDAYAAKMAAWLDEMLEKSGK